VTLAAVRVAAASLAFALAAANAFADDYPPALKTPEERACYDTFRRESSECTLDYDYAVAGCANDSFFGRQMCTMAAYYFWNQCTDKARAAYSSCLSGAWQRQQPLPGGLARAAAQR
jgi:hypothetical protein